MIKIKTSKANGYVEYEITDDTELQELPKRGILNGSIAMRRKGKYVTKYTFVQVSENEDGEWV